MWQRLSIVDNFKLGLAVSSSAVNIGDANFIYSTRDNFSVKREYDTFFDFEGNTIQQYKIFSEKPEFEPIYERLSMSTFHANPYIKVNKLSILGVASAIAHIGSGDSIKLESRSINISQLKE